MSYIGIFFSIYNMKVKLQKLREGTKYQGYRVAIPKSIIEAKGWDNLLNLKLEDKGKYLILKPIKRLR